MQVMLQDDEDKEQRLDVQICTHGNGPPVFGDYLLEKTTRRQRRSNKQPLE